MMYFYHQLRSSTTPWVRLRAWEIVEMKRVPSQIPKKIPTFARVPLEPVTTIFATRESMISCTFGSAGMKFFNKCAEIAEAELVQRDDCQPRQRDGERVVMEQRDAGQCEGEQHEIDGNAGNRQGEVSVDPVCRGPPIIGPPRL